MAVALEAEIVYLLVSIPESARMVFSRQGVV